jgi:predicted house-cleaning NTP pyrophosphatase (Maf/HAM1 superfamily)
VPKNLQETVENPATTESVPGVEIILASVSPRRRQLLSGLGVRFEVATADVTELDAITSPQFGPVELARENARRKAAAVAKLFPGRWVLGADTSGLSKRSRVPART